MQVAALYDMAPWGIRPPSHPWCFDFRFSRSITTFSRSSQTGDVTRQHLGSQIVRVTMLALPWSALEGCGVQGQNRNGVFAICCSSIFQLVGHLNLVLWAMSIPVLLIEEVAVMDLHLIWRTQREHCSVRGLAFHSHPTRSHTRVTKALATKSLEGTEHSLESPRQTSNHQEEGIHEHKRRPEQRGSVSIRWPLHLPRIVREFVESKCGPAKGVFPRSLEHPTERARVTASRTSSARSSLPSVLSTSFETRAHTTRSALPAALAGATKTAMDWVWKVAVRHDV